MSLTRVFFCKSLHSQAKNTGTGKKHLEKYKIKTTEDTEVVISSRAANGKWE